MKEDKKGAARVYSKANVVEPKIWNYNTAPSLYRLGRGKEGEVIPLRHPALLQQRGEQDKQPEPHVQRVSVPG